MSIELEQQATNEELAIAIKAGHDQDKKLIWTLWQQVGRLALSVGRKYGRGLIEMDDLYQICFLAIYPAIEHFNPELGSFSTVLVQWTRQQVLRYLDDCGGVIRIPVASRSMIRRYNKFFAEYVAGHGKKPEPFEIMIALNISDKTYDTLMDALRAENCSSLDKPFVGTEGNDIVVGDTVPDLAVDVEELVIDKVQRQELYESIWQQVDNLLEQQAAVLRMRYQEGMTLQQVGEVLKISQERVRQVEQKAIRELRKPSKAKHLQPFLPDQAAIIAMHGSAGSFKKTWTSSTEYAAFSCLKEEEDEIQAMIDRMRYGH